MSSDNLNAQLGKLQAILGKKVVLDAPERNETNATASTHEQHTHHWEEEHLDIKMRLLETSDGHDDKRARRLSSPGKSSASYKDINSSTLNIGEQIDEEIPLCPWDAVIHYPARFIGKANKPRAQPFFDKLLEGKTWDFFYIQDPTEPEGQPCLLVPTSQFVRFLEGINRILDTQLVIPVGPNERLFNLHFGVGGTPRPRYLLRSRDQKRLLIDDWPAASKEDLKSFEEAAPAHRDLWLSTWEKTKQHSLPKSRGASDRAEKNRAARLQMLSQTQLYLGLQGPRCPPDKPIIFLCVDIEAIEVAPNPVSEIGIAILDTRQLQDMAAGPAAENWWQFIEAHHMRVKEYAGLVNYRFVMGCPRNFDFGTSTFPRQAELVDTLNSTLAAYTNGTCDVVLVGHDIQSDIQYLSGIGFPTDQLPGLVDTVDTQTIYRAWQDDTQARSLGTVLSRLGIPYKNLHNAGNDAVFTLRAMAAIAVEHMNPTWDQVD